MNSAVFSSRLSTLRLRLAQRLTVTAILGLSAALALLLGCMVLAVLAAGWSWTRISHGDPLQSALFSLLTLACLLGTALLLDLLCTAAPLPAGLPLPRERAQQLYAVLDELAQRFGVDPIRQVLITDELNAQIHQRPIYGLCGSVRTTLMIGLPLAHSLSPTQFSAVLAHEFGHLAAQRRGWAAVAGVLRAWWLRVLDRASAELGLFGLCLDRWSVRVCIDMLRLSRLEEYEADALAAGLVGSELMGEALVEVSLKSRFFERDYWPWVLAHNSLSSRPRLLPYRDMALGVEAGFLRTVSELAVAVEEDENERYAFHPSLRQRLRALGVRQRVPAGSRCSAAQYFLAPLLPVLAGTFDRAWWQAWHNQRGRWLMDGDEYEY